MLDKIGLIILLIIISLGLGAQIEMPKLLSNKISFTGVSLEQRLGYGLYPTILQAEQPTFIREHALGLNASVYGMPFVISYRHTNNPSLINFQRGVTVKLDYQAYLKYLDVLDKYDEEYLKAQVDSLAGVLLIIERQIDYLKSLDSEEIRRRAKEKLNQLDADSLKRIANDSLLTFKDSLNIDSIKFHEESEWIDHLPSNEILGTDSLSMISWEFRVYRDYMIHSSIASEFPYFIKYVQTDSISDVVPDVKLDVIKDIGGVGTEIGDKSLADSLVVKPLPKDQDFDRKKYYEMAADSVGNKIKFKELLEKKDSIKDRISEVQSKIEFFKNGFKEFKDKLPSKKKMNITGLSLGFFSPDLSDIFLQGLALKGGLVRLQRNNKEHNLFFGRTQSFAQNDPLNWNLRDRINQLNGIWNPSVALNSRMIGGYKGGFGLVDSSHTHFGFLVGRGPLNVFAENSEVANNYVGEFEWARVNEFSKIQLNFVQTYIRRNFSSSEFSSQLEDSKLGYAGKLGFEKMIEAWGLKLNASGKYFSPTYENYGLGVSRKDYISLETKIAKSTKKLGKFSFGTRTDKSNLSGTLPVSISMNNYKVNWSKKLGKKIYLNLNLLNSTVETEFNEFSSEIVQNVGTLNLTQQIRIGKLRPSVNYLYSQTILISDSLNTDLSLISITSVAQLNKEYQMSIGISYAEQVSVDLREIYSVIGEVSTTYSTKSGAITVGSKFGEVSKSFEWGASAELSTQAIKNFDIALYGERVIWDQGISSYFSEIDYASFRYRIELKLVYTLNFQ